MRTRAQATVGGESRPLVLYSVARSLPWWSKAMGVAGPDLRLPPGNDPVDIGGPPVRRDAAQQADVEGPARPDRHRGGHGLCVDGVGGRVPNTPAGNVSAAAGKRAGIDTFPVGETYSRSLPLASTTTQPPR
jgi:hypothetical protein